MPSGKLVLAVSDPAVPVTVTVPLPSAAVLLAVSVSRLSDVVCEGARLAVTPAGSPVAASFTLPLNPYREAR